MPASLGGPGDENVQAVPGGATRMVARLFGGEFMFSIEQMEHVYKLTLKSGERRRPEVEDVTGGDSSGFEAAGDSGPQRPAREGSGEQQGGGGNGTPARLCAEQDLQGYGLIWGRLWVKSLIKAKMWTGDGPAGPPGKL